ncbi:MAG: tRNA(Met) cytidine acetyltransferase TmcA [Halobacteriaceae archaeon]
MPFDGLTSLMDAVADLASALRAEAEETDERRALLCHGGRDDCEAAAREALDAAGVDWNDVSLVSSRRALPCERVGPKHADRLLGTTREAVVVDAHDTCRPNALGQVAGAVDGGGLLVYLAPPLDEWRAADCAFHRSLAVPPHGVGEVTARYHERFARLARTHRGVAVVDAGAGRVERDGLTDPAPRLPGESPGLPAEHAFPAAAYEACLTADQVEAVREFEALRTGPRALVVEADRGRGKSSAAGLAAACFAAAGESVLVTAPSFAGARPLFERAAALLDALGALRERDERRLRADAGEVAFALPPEAAARAGDEDVDVLVVDEAAALPVRLLEETLAAPRVAYVTTVHGYEGAGRGFDVRFRDRLAESDRDVTDVALRAPVRYAEGDPVESWAFHALLLDARPPVDELVADATPEAASFDRLPAADLAADENLLRASFGLLVAAHYRTEPNDLVRLLDAPNVSVRALRIDGHVASVALLAGEGGLDAATRREMYEGGRVAGNMLPDVLASQLRDEAAAALRGVRVLRIATHHAARSRGLGSRLLGEVAGDVDASWLGVGFGATPELLSFWDGNGFDAVHLSTTRNDASGEYSAMMLRPLDGDGRALRDRHAAWFADRVGAVLGDTLSDLDADVTRAALRACGADVEVDLDDRGWRLVAGAAYGPALYDVDPRPFRALARKHLVDPADPDLLAAREERLLVRKVLQAADWERVAAELDYHSRGECMRSLGDAYRPLVDAYGSAAADEEAARYREKD